MILAFDTYYFDNKAKTVCVEFENWADKEYKVYSEIIENVAEYIPGEFYKRELPCIISLYNKLETNDTKVIIVDGFVYLDDSCKPGLGAHLYNELQGKIPVIGVAKTNFATIENLKYKVFRGESKNPLYITSVGIELNEAAGYIQQMHGEYRIPTLLKSLDQYTKSDK